MKNTVKHIPYLLVIVVSIILTHCKSPEEPKETLADTTIVQADSGKVARVGSLKTPADTMVASVPLTLIVSNLASPTAPVIVGVYKSRYKFMYKESRIKEYTFVPNGNTLTALITDINYGEIAIAIYQDMNSNGKLDKNPIGMPTEGYCFSNNFKPKIKAPGYDDCKFIYSAKINKVVMTLIR